MINGGRLERWAKFHNCLVGYVFDHPIYPPGTRVITDSFRFIDLNNKEAECVDEKYKLGEPGTTDEHNQPLFGQKNG